MKNFPYTNRIDEFDNSLLKEGYFKAGKYIFQSCGNCSAINKLYSIYCRFCSNKIKNHENIKSIGFLGIKDISEYIKNINLSDDYIYIKLVDFILIVNDKNVFAVYPKSDFKVRFFKKEYISKDSILFIKTDYKYFYFYTKTQKIKVPIYIFISNPNNPDYFIYMMSLSLNNEDESLLAQINSIYDSFIKNYLVTKMTKKSIQKIDQENINHDTTM